MSALNKAGRVYGNQSGEVDAYLIQASGKLPCINCSVQPRFQVHPCSVLKTHSQFSPQGQPHSFPGLTAQTVGYIHVYRNPLDVLLSYINYSRLEYKSNQGSVYYRKRLFHDLLGFDKVYSYDDWLEQGIDTIPVRNLDHALDHFSASGIAIPHLQNLAGSWASHLESWHSVPDEIPGHTIRYEDCVSDSSAFDPLADMFLFGPAELRAAVGSVNQAARKFSAEGNQNQVIFFNKMRAYYYPDYYSQSAVSRFCAAHGEILAKYGYQSILDNA